MRPSRNVVRSLNHVAESRSERRFRAKLAILVEEQTRIESPGAIAEHSSKRASGALEDVPSKPQCILSRPCQRRGESLTFSTGSLDGSDEERDGSDYQQNRRNPVEDSWPGGVADS